MKDKKPRPQINLVTHIRNKDGVITRTDPYRLIIENGVQKFERPPGSGIFYAANGELLTKPKEVKMSKEEAIKLEAQKPQAQAAPKAQAPSSLDEALGQIKL